MIHDRSDIVQCWIRCARTADLPRCYESTTWIRLSKLLKKARSLQSKDGATPSERASVRQSVFLGRLGNVSPAPDGGYPGGNTASARGRQSNSSRYTVRHSRASSRKSVSLKSRIGVVAADPTAKDSLGNWHNLTYEIPYVRLFRRYTWD